MVVIVLVRVVVAVVSARLVVAVVVVTPEQELLQHEEREDAQQEEGGHPKAKSAITDGEQIVDARLQEENEAKKVLSKLEGLDVDSAEFEEMLQSFKSAVIAHAEAEEREEFSRLQAELDDDHDPQQHPDIGEQLQHGPRRPFRVDPHGPAA